MSHPRIETQTVYYVRTLDRGRVGPITERGIAESIAKAEDARLAAWEASRREAAE